MSDEEKKDKPKDEKENESPQEEPSPKKKVDEEWKKQARTEKQKGEEKAKGSARPPLPPVNLAMFVNSFAVQALMALGDIENPVTKKAERDLDQAKYTIDILAMLEEKTRGNLTDQEKKLLDQVLYDLRMRYVSAVGR